MSESEIIVSRVDRLGSIRLNRPEALNSLTLGMVRAFTAALDDFKSDPSICAVLVTGAGPRGLCAGGDIRRLYDLRAGGRDYYKTFWREEYQLNARIASFPKPYVVVMDGVVMGGGVGISAHGNRRVVTERTRLAMPETGIGFIPDVGGTWLLTRNGGAGIYMGLSGAAVGPADAIRLGFADVLIDSQALPELERSLATINVLSDVDALLTRLARPPPEPQLAQYEAAFDRVMREARVEDVIAALANEGSEFFRRAASDIGGKSPISLKVTHELLKRAAVAERLESCLVNEFRAACRLLDTHDLYEGIRAAIIDKDRCPHWRPTTLAEVDEEAVLLILEGTGDPEPFPERPRSERIST